MSLFTWNVANALCLLSMKYFCVELSNASWCLQDTYVVHQGTLFISLFFFKVDNLWELPSKILSKIFSSIRQCASCSQVHTLHLDSSSMGRVFKEDIYAKANSEMKKVIPLAFIIHFQNDELNKMSVTGTIQLFLTFIFPYYWLI